MNTIASYRSTFVLLLATSLVALVSCSDVPTDPCPPGNYQAGEFITTGIADIKLYQRTEEGLAQLDENTPVTIDELELYVSNDFTNRVAEVEERSSFNLFDWLLKPAYACSILEPIVSEVVGMDIISNASFGAAFPPGTSLKNIFYAEPTNTNAITDTSGWYGYLRNDEADSRQLSAYTAEDPTRLATGYVIKLSLSTEAAAIAIETSELHRLTYTVELATGEMYQVTSPAVLISAR